MILLENGRSCLYQWDIDQRVEIESAEEIIEVHFVNAVTSPALVVSVYEEDGRRFANIPNILLQQFWPIQAYGCCASRVRDVETFKVIRREKPADYIYTETELKTYGSLEERIEANAEAIEKIGEAAEKNAETAASLGRQTDNLADQIRASAPDFSASGPAPICRPLAGDPLTVLSRIDIRQEGSGDPSPSNVRPIVRHSQVSLTITDDEGQRVITKELATPVIQGSFNWATGEARNDARIRDIGAATPVETGTSSSGIRYVRLMVAGAPLTTMLACNRYRITTALPSASGYIRIVGTMVYVYDNAIDFDNPAAAYAGTEVVEPAAETVVQEGPMEVLAGRGVNTIVSSTGDTEVSGKAVLDALEKTDLPEAINTALAQAKESGEFDGPQGIPGEKGEKGDRGEKGDPGEPGKDATPYTLPAATADTLGGVKVGNGLVMTGDVLGMKPDGVYELIESFAIEEDTLWVGRTQEPNGKNYALKAVRVKIISKPSEQQNAYIYFNGEEKEVSAVYLVSYSHAENERTTTAICFPLYGYWYAFNLGSANDSYNNSPPNNYPKLNGNASVVENPYITRISMKANGNFRTGTIIEIWGVRANA